MYNSKNISTARSHDDHNLEEVIDTSSDPVFGYLAYQLALISKDHCEWLLDPKYNTNIVLTVPFVEVNGVNNESPVSWTIPYVPLVSPIKPVNTPVWNLPTDFNENLLVPLAVPPNERNSDNDWQEFARFVWNQITLGKY